MVKSEKLIDFETSLASVKRIEVIQGAGSVLWGSDAFAGVINVVPKTGKDLQGIETGVISDTENYPGEAFLNHGMSFSDWSTFVSVAGRKNQNHDDSFNVIRFWHDGNSPEPLETRFGLGYPDDSHYVTVYGNAAYQNWLTFSMRFSDSSHAYTVSDWDQIYSWEEKNASQAQMYKIEMFRNLDPDSDIRFTGYHTRLLNEQTFIGRAFEREESSLFGEIVYDRSLFVSHGLLTLGASWRRDRYDRIPVWGSFFPDLLQPANLYFLPVVDNIDFENDLRTVFGQYRHDLGDVEVWAGFRYDDHDRYEDKVSFNSGLAWNMSSYMFKLIYGTGYRTPFARQLKQDLNHKLEKISNLNAQLSWKTPDTQASITGFANRIENHVIEDRYAGAGLSTPNKQTLFGVELELDHQLTDRISLGGNLTLLRNSGPKEVYYYNDYSYIDKDGNLVKNFLDLEHEYLMGPDIMGSVAFNWQMTPHVMLASELHYFSGQNLYYPIKDEAKSCDSAWTLDLNLHVRDLWPFDLSLFATNLLDNDHAIPGVYSVTRPMPQGFGISVRTTW